MLHLFAGEEALLHDDLTDRLARVVGFLSEHSGVLVTDVRQQSRDNADALVEPFLALLAVRLEVDEELVDERVTALAMYVIELNMLKAMTGSMTLSSNWPFSTAIETARSLPMTW